MSGRNYILIKENKMNTLEQNTNRELFREGDYYSPSLYVTKDNEIGINVGGSVFVMSLREWHKRAESFISKTEIEKIEIFNKEDKYFILSLIKQYNEACDGIIKNYIFSLLELVSNPRLVMKKEE
jgi:hypothetical protein